VTVPGRYKVGGMETRGTSKSKGTSIMKGVGLPIVESYKARRNFLITFKIVQII